MSVLRPRSLTWRLVGRLAGLQAVALTLLILLIGAAVIGLLRAGLLIGEYEGSTLDTLRDAVTRDEAGGLTLFHIGPDIEAGRLVPVLQNLNPGDREDIHAVYVGHAGPLPARVRAFIDFLAQHIRIGDPALRRSADGKWKVVGDK